MFRITALIIVIAVLSWAAVGCSPQSCKMQAGSFLSEIKQLASEWDDANNLAGHTSRIALSAQIARLQEIRRKTAELKAPECAQSVQKAFVLYMDQTVEGYLAFMSQKPEKDVQALFESAQVSMDRAVRWLGELEAGKD